MSCKKWFCLLLALCLLVGLTVGCGEKPAEVTTTTVGDNATTTLADEVTTTVAGDTTTGDDEATTTVGGEDPTTVDKDDPTTAVKDETTAAGNKATTTKKPDVTTQKPDGTTKKVTTTTTKKVTTTAAPTTQKVYGKTMYVDWDPEARMLQVVQKYSSTHDLVSIIKPIAPNQILNFVFPKIIANKTSDISNDLAAAKLIYGMPESDWLGPHHINNDWHGGSHGHGSTATGETVDVALKVDGKATSGNVGTYAGEVTLSYTNNLWTTPSKEVFMQEFYTLTFDGEKWSVDCTLKMLKNVSNWKEYYGMQCTYGVWQETIQYGDDEPISIAKAETPGYTEASSWDCDTMILRGNSGHALEMKLDRTYGLGRGTMMSKATDAGAFTRAYPHPNGKAYFRLVSGGRNPSANAKFMWRGTYRFFCEE